jgi:hypothetical protein
MGSRGILKFRALFGQSHSLGSDAGAAVARYTGIADTAVVTSAAARAVDDDTEASTSLSEQGDGATTQSMKCHTAITRVASSSVVEMAWASR